MKSCPACLTQYTDNSLQYCLQDGTPLIGGHQSNVPTAVMGETETLVKPRPGDSQLDTRPDVHGAEIHPETRPERRSSRSYTAAAVLITAAVMLIVFGVLGLAAFMYFRERVPIATTNANTARSGDNPQNINLTRPNTPSPTATAENKQVSNTTPTVNRPGPSTSDTAIREEVASEIDAWLSKTEQMDVATLMSHYAPKVDYYNKKGASIADIRVDKNRAFSRYSDIRIKSSNLKVTTNESKDIATAVFDKEWRFQGERTSEGKVRQLLQLRKTNGRWLITAERDLKVY